jgi:hypothetical protein
MPSPERRIAGLNLRSWSWRVSFPLSSRPGSIRVAGERSEYPPACLRRIQGRGTERSGGASARPFSPAERFAGSRVGRCTVAERSGAALKRTESGNSWRRQAARHARRERAEPAESLASGIWPQSAGASCLGRRSLWVPGWCLRPGTHRLKLGGGSEVGQHSEGPEAHGSEEHRSRSELAVLTPPGAASVCVQVCRAEASRASASVAGGMSGPPHVVPYGVTNLLSPALSSRGEGAHFFYVRFSQGDALG